LETKEKLKTSAAGKTDMKNHRKSRIKRARKSGFLKRSSSKKGRKILSHKRRAGRKVNVDYSM